MPVSTFGMSYVTVPSTVHLCSTFRPDWPLCRLSAGSSGSFLANWSAPKGESSFSRPLLTRPLPVTPGSIVYCRGDGRSAPLNFYQGRTITGTASCRTISSYSRRSLPRKCSDDPRQSLVRGPVHWGIVLQVVDGRFQTGPSGGQSLELGGLFVQTLGLSLAGNRHLGNLLQKSASSLLRLPPVRRQPLGNLHPAFMSLARLVLGDAGDMRFASAVDPSCPLQDFP